MKPRKLIRGILALLVLLGAPGVGKRLLAAPAASTAFVRGDSNGDGAVDVSDAVHVLLHLFAGGGELPCADASDSNDDGALDLADAMRTLGFLFQDGASLPGPQGCGIDPTEDTLGCDSFPACGEDPLSELGDDFEGSSLDPSWSVARPGMAQIAVAGGSLSLRAAGYSLWFQASRGPILYKLVSGDFRVTSRVHARRASDETLAPAQNIHLGGIIARDPAGESGGAENYVFIVLGQDVDDPSVETKTTANSESSYQGPSWPTPDAELRICRLGSIFRLYKRPVEGGAWSLAAAYDRPDLPETLQVGAIIYAPSNSPDLIVRFDELTFEESTGVADCTSGG